MRYSDIVSPYTGTSTHPYMATIFMNPAQWATFCRSCEDQPEVRQLGIDKTSPGRWTVYAACASRAVRDLLERPRCAVRCGCFGRRTTASAKVSRPHHGA